MLDIIAFWWDFMWSPDCVVCAVTAWFPPAAAAAIFAAAWSDYRPRHKRPHKSPPVEAPPQKPPTEAALYLAVCRVLQEQGQFNVVMGNLSHNHVTEAVWVGGVLGNSAEDIAQNLTWSVGAR